MGSSRFLLRCLFRQKDALPPYLIGILRSSFNRRVYRKREQEKANFYQR